ncbi:MAG: Ig-like domain repeat protein, partial [Verrucomicrobiota bacterium]
SLTVADGITVTNPISLSGYGVSGAGAIQSFGGINGYAGPITLLADAGIGVWANSLTISQIANSVFTLRKSGTSPLIVTGTPAFAGSFAVFGGTLQVDGTLPATGSATVSSGATLDGTGTAGEVTVLSGGHFAPGHSPGTITATSLTLNSGALFDEEINGTTAGTLYDVTQVSGTPGTVALGNATLNVTLGYTPAVGDTYAIINATGGVSGTFKDSLGNTLTNGATLTVASQLLRINYTSTTVTLTAVLPTTTVLVSSLNPSTSGSNVTFTSTVSPSAASGTVTFKDGTTTLGTGTLSGGVGVATFTTNGLSGGRRTITAAYGGDGNYNGSVSSPLTQIVAWVPVQSGFWDDTATWGGTLPDAGDDVVIPLGITVKVRVDPLMVRNLTVFGTLTVNGAPTLQISGNFTNNGTFTPDTGTVTLTGDADQTLVATAPGALNFYKLTENKSATINTVTCASHLTVSKKLTLSKGKLVSASDYEDIFIDAPGELQLTSDITVSGNFTNHGTLTTSGHGITFDGGVEQNLSLANLTTFDNLTVTAGTTLIETETSDSVLVQGTLLNQGVIRKTQPVTIVDSYYFGLAGNYGVGLEIDVTSLAGLNPLTAIQVDRVDTNPPNAPGTNVTGNYWTITPTGNDFLATLILPQDDLADPQ